MSKLLEFFLGSILIAVFTVALMFFSVLQYVLRVGSSDNCAWYGSAKIWLDSNGDGQLNRGEPPLADVEIHVDDVGNGLVDIGWPAITDKDGEALLNVQIPGCSDTVFEIYVDAPEGYQITTQPRIQVNPDALQTAEVEPVYYFGFASAGDGFQMLYVALALLILALLFFWQSNRQRRAAGLPGGRVIYTDTRGWGKLEKPLFYQALGLTGKPDYLIQQNGQILPVEVKSGRAPESPYDSHIYQLASYCLLVEKTYGKRPAYGIIHYNNRDFAIDYTQELESALLDLLAEMKRDEHKKEVPRSHEQATRCARCGFRKVCDQSLV